MQNILLKISILLIFTSIIQLKAFSQQSVTSSLSGQITDAETKEPVIGCVVVITELNLWATTNNEGFYKIDKIPTGGEYTIATSCLGMEKYEKQFKFDDNKGYELNISLKENSIKLLTINVLAEEGRGSGIGTYSKIKENAIEHLQPSSLKDVMQLLPGQVSTNPDLSGPARISIRDIGNDANSSLGTSVIVDGAPVSNNAELQSTGNMNMSGVDVRQISTDNIESVEVIRGIASVTYGDMTSGAVIVKTKSGETPLNAKVTLNPKIKKAYIGKGFRLDKNRGAINIDLDYTSSVDSKVTPSEGFERLSAQIGYSNTFLSLTSPLTFNIKGKYSQTIDSKKTDPDLLTFDEEREVSEYGYWLNVFGRWALKKKLLSNLSYNFSIDTRNQKSYSNERITLGYVQPISNARVDTLMEGVYADPMYYTKMTVDGKPFDIYAKIVADVTSRYESGAFNMLTYGFDFKSNGNNGEGKIYDELKPPRVGGGNGTRPRPYNDIPSLTQYSLFLEDRFSLPLNKTILFVQAGIRYNNFQPKGIFTSELKTNVEPRINIEYSLLRAKNYSLSLIGGYGIQSKSPTISYLYPDKAYFDLTSFNYFPINPDEKMILVSTRVIDTEYDKIEPISVTKYEAGLEGRIKNFRFLFTGYFEKSTNGLNFANQVAFTEFNRWDITDPNILFRTGEKPIIDLSLPTAIDTFIANYSSPRNNQVMIKKGLEYRFDFGELKAIKTSLNINGGYLYTKNYSGTETYSLPSGNGADQLPYVGVYPSGSGTERQRLNSNFVGITHFPKLGIIFTTTLQVIWKNSTKYFLGGGQPWNYTSPLGEDYFVKAPIALISKDGARHEITKENILQREYDYYLNEYNERYFIPENEPVHYQLNLKVTSEISSAAKFSFFANNFTMHNPKYQSKRNDDVYILNSSIYFGLELTFLL